MSTTSKRATELPAERKARARGCLRLHPGIRSRAGFTMIELLAVLVILSILMVVLIPRLAGVGELAKAKLTRQFMSQLDAAIAEYDNRFGDFPPSSFLDAKWGSPPNSTNMGAETLVLSLWSPEWGGTNLPEDKLVNSDGDETKKALARFPKTSLFELKDSWDNPIAYFHRRDYGRQDMYALVNPDTGELNDSGVTARKNATTGNFHNPNKCQLISAGPDGEFGTEDDIGNFEDAN